MAEEHTDATRGTRAEDTVGTDARNRRADLAGTTAILAGVVSLMGIITAEVLYPEYSTRQDISDLGSTLPSDPVIHQPSATIFNATMIVTGLLVLVAAVSLHRRRMSRLLTVPFLVLGAGIVGVGLFPGYVMPWHAIAAMLAFTSGGIAVVLSSRVVRRPFSWLCLLLGTVSLLTLASAIVFDISGIENPLAPLGSGGIERWVVYPLLLWIPAFGGYLLGGGPVAGTPDRRG